MKEKETASFTVAKILRVLKLEVLVFSGLSCFTVAKILRVLKHEKEEKKWKAGFTVAKILRVLKHSIRFWQFSKVLQ